MFCLGCVTLIPATNSPPLIGLAKEGLLSVAFSDSEYFSMFAQLDSVGMRFYRAREHAAVTYPLYFLAADKMAKVVQVGLFTIVSFCC